MDHIDLYRMVGPTSWAEAPRAFSFSSLKRMEVCLRQWQIERSSYGDHKKYPERPSEAAEVGRIVHDLLSRLFHATALAGYPALGSEGFVRAVESVDLLGRARRALEAFARGAAANPRALGFRPRATPRDVYNQVAQAFREEYTRILADKGSLPPIPPAAEDVRAAGATPAERPALLERLGVLSEQEVRHPELPVLGIIDLLVRRDGRTTVLDFKTGASRPEYRRQIQLYALLWWRSTGDLPAHVELRYGARVEGWPVSAEELRRLEEELAAEIRAHTRGLAARPAAASVGPRCEGCSVRQLCGDYWASLPRAIGGKDGQRVDVEVVVTRAGAKAGFAGLARGGEVTVVFEEDAGAFFGPFAEGEKLRILGASWDAEGEALRLTRGAEVFRI